MSWQKEDVNSPNVLCPNLENITCFLLPLQRTARKILWKKGGPATVDNAHESHLREIWRRGDSVKRNGRKQDIIMFGLQRITEEKETPHKGTYN